MPTSPPDVDIPRNLIPPHKSDAGYLDVAANGHGAEKALLMHRALGRLDRGRPHLVEIGPGGGAAVARLMALLTADLGHAGSVRLTLVEAPSVESQSLRAVIEQFSRIGDCRLVGGFARDLRTLLAEPVDAVAASALRQDQPGPHLRGDPRRGHRITMNVTEVERKRELADPAALTSRLAAAGYRLTRTDREIDTYYSRPDRDFLSTVECLRVRRRDGHVEITYKPPSTATTHGVDDIITKEETTVVLADDQQATAAHTLLGNLDMVLLCEVDKTRTTYRHPEDPTVTVVIDVVAGVGTFAETEVLSTDPDDAGTMLDRVERQLHLDSLTVIGLPYRDLVLQQDRSGTAS